MTIQGTRGDGVRMVSFTEMELRARDEAIIRAAKLHITGDPYIDHVPGPVYDQIIAAAEQEPTSCPTRLGPDSTPPNRRHHE